MTKLLIFIAIVAGIAALIQLIRLNEVAAEARGGNSEENITPQENNFMAYTWIIFMIAFFGFTIWLMAKYKFGGLGPSASAHGEELDWLLQLNYWIILPVFFLTNALLFIFVFKYRYNENRRATYFAHSSKLEMVWTVLPAAVLAVIIFMGLKTWKDIMFDTEGQIVEVYAERFDWKFRVSGGDNTLGDADFKLITGESHFINSEGKLDTLTANPLGVVSKDLLLAKYAEIDTSIAIFSRRLDAAKNEAGAYYKPNEQIEEWLDMLEQLNRQKYRIEAGIGSVLTAEKDSAANDDVVIALEPLHLIVNKPVKFKFRSKDVIHSALFPHFRAQMNCVPGLVTSFTFTPIYTTQQMAEIPEVREHYKQINEIHRERLLSLGLEEEYVDFNFVLLCNKICGASHNNMQRNIIVETEEEYEKWIECVDHTEAVPVQPRLDVGGNPVIYWGDGALDKVNMAIKNAKIQALKTSTAVPVMDTIVEVDSVNIVQEELLVE